MKIRDLNLDDYVIVYDIGKSENSEGMTVVGKVIDLIFNDENANLARINSMGNLYTITDNNYFDLWSNYIESKTESVSDKSIPKAGQEFYFDAKDLGPHNFIKINNQSNDVQQRKRNDTVNHPSHYKLGNLEVKDIVALVADKYHKGSVAHNIASAIEYEMRAPEKNGLEDIKKARKCLDFAIENWDVK